MWFYSARLSLAGLVQDVKLTVVDFIVLVKNLEMELDLMLSGKGTAEENTGQIYITLNGIEDLNMANYPRKESSR